MNRKVSRRDFVKLTAIAGSAVGAAGVLPRMAAAQAVPTLTVAWGTDIDTLDPAQFKSDGSYIVQCNIYDTVLQWERFPFLARPGLSMARRKFLGRSPKLGVRDDGKTLVLNIRRGLKFPSGKPINAAAVIVSLRSRSAVAGLYGNIFPTLIAVTKPEQFEVRDDYTFAINMPGPSAMLLDTVTLSNNALLDPDEVKAGTLVDRRSLGGRVAEAQYGRPRAVSSRQQRARR